ncbi:hypothetical protein VP01_1893g1 [Puccinia sorghi]|uniref:Uncharacterized protein n=1 Tax=Puccinia sorghi TaxID=27349 RepID=A0A0L6VET8_9BASI|nr:hypothetical protein VP01_1893g1 [Puccinia sorghi]
MLQPSCHPNSTFLHILVESCLENGWSNNRSFLGISSCQLQAFEQVFFFMVISELSLAFSIKKIEKSSLIDWDFSALHLSSNKLKINQNFKCAHNSVPWNVENRIKNQNQNAKFLLHIPEVTSFFSILPAGTMIQQCFDICFSYMQIKRMEIGEILISDNWERILEIEDECLVSLRLKLFLVLFLTRLEARKDVQFKASQVLKDFVKLEMEMSVYEVDVSAAHMCGGARNKRSGTVRNMKLSLKQSWLSPLTLRYYKTIMYMYFSLVRSQPKKWSGVTQLQWFLQIIQFQKQFDLISWKKNQFISPRLILSNFEKILCVRIHESICRQKWQKPSRKGFLKRFRWFL